jgi:ketosteroid isomerase-like protein
MVCATALAQNPERDKKDHDELRALLRTFTEAFNSRNIDPLVPYLHKDFSVTMVNQDVVTDPKALKGYLDSQFTAPGSRLKDAKIQPEADVLTLLYEGRVGVNRGSSTDTYTLKDGRVFTLKTRWSGTAIQEDGKWKVLNAHIGLNILDNPILDEIERLRWIWGAAGLAIGIALGALGMMLVRRRRPAA